MSELELTLLGSRIRNARRDCGLTQKELAEQTELAVKTVYDIEKGRKILLMKLLVRSFADFARTLSIADMD